MNRIIGTTTLEWHSVDDTPKLHTEEYEGESWMQSQPLLLADADGKMAVGYCQKSSDGKTEFDTACTQVLGKTRAWAVLGKLPFLGVSR